eukprot:TRINITY_DN27067_c0_g1_i1.p1 TRINITY_DN27067_c0_g1~~TRINITY_DN27067_c0_g1_i1.p1  ORF type:complete len:470 (-),score=62.96 TRINITY_DN27067_c0_g1_i1:216-1625(-)
MGFSEELSITFWLAFPTMIRCYIGCAATNGTLGFVGHYDPSEVHIASAAFGKMYSNVTCLSMGIGMALGINTFAAQNHGRDASAENGVVFRRCCQAFLPAFAFSSSVVVLAQQILTGLGQPQDLIRPSQQFTLIQLAGMPAKWMFEALNNTLNSQCIVTPGMWCDSITSVLNFVLAFVLLARGSGFLGSAWAFTVSQWTCLALMVMYIRSKRLGGTVWKLPPKVSSAGQVSFVSYMAATLPSAFSLWSEWWASEVLAMLAGMLPGKDASVGANGILLNTVTIFYMTFVGVQSASTTRVGNLVGAQDAERIPTAIKSATLLSAIFSLICSLGLQIFGTTISRLWTQNPEILHEATKANLGMVICVPPYAVTMCLLGVLRGAGLQLRGAVAIFVAFFILGLPLGAFLGLHAGWGLIGIWYGNFVGLTLAATSIGIQVYFISWPKVIEDSIRNERSQGIIGSQRELEARLSS